VVPARKRRRGRQSHAGKKFAYYGEKFDTSIAIENVRRNRFEWERDLRHLLKKLPEFDKLEQEVERKFEQIS